MNDTSPAILLQPLLSTGPVRSAASAAVRAPGPSGTEHAGRASSGVDELAREFEAMMTRQVLRQMRESQLSDNEDEGFGAGTLTETTDAEFARMLASGSPWAWRTR